ncbi:MAG TPA: MBL fold metallo-hydrolase, partial [Candidatus Limnocylindrales bacterium]
THAHPDHAGAAASLARAWRAPIFVHPAELAIAQGDFDAMRACAGPLDRWLILPLLRAMGRRRREALLERSSLRGLVRPLEGNGVIEDVPAWRWVHTPGHTPGHISLVRDEDRVALTGDAMVTLRVNSVAGVLLGSPGLSGPPRYTTWSWGRAKASLRVLADLEPTVVGGGHGQPLTGPDTAALVRAFARTAAPSDPPEADRR